MWRLRFSFELSEGLDKSDEDCRYIDLQYADDCVILAHTSEELKRSLDILTAAYQSLGFSINIRKPRSSTKTL